MSFSDYLVTDDLTVLLGFIGVSVFLLQSLYKPQPLVHPILLGRQSDVGRVRRPSESAIYRNYGTGFIGRLPVRPDKDVDLVNDFVKPQFESPRTLWSTKITNARLNERIAAFGAGISRVLSPESHVLLFLDDSLEFIIADLALAKHSIVSLTLTSPKLLPRVLENHPPSAIIVHADFLPRLLESVHDPVHTIIVVGQVESDTHPKLASQIQILNWTQVEADGAQVVNTVTPPSVRPDGQFTHVFFQSSSGHLQQVGFTHTNFTSGVTAIRALFPPSIALSSLDTVVSGHSLSTPFGRAIAYTALYESTCFATCDSTRIYHNSNDDLPRNVNDILSASKLPIPSPTILFVHPDHLLDLSSAILSRAKKMSFAYSIGWRHKLAALVEGFISKDSLWDRAMFDGARERVIGRMANTLKAVVIGGGSFPNEALTPARIALSVPLVNTHAHTFISGPVFATHAFDLQSLPSAEGELAHVGAPSVNVEVKLIGVDDEAVEKGNDPQGKLLVRGPSVGMLASESVGSTEAEGWVQMGEIARVMTNGAFKVVGAMSD